MGLPHIISDHPAGAQPDAQRRPSGHKRKFVSQMTPWSPGVASLPVEVVIEEISASGVSVVHDQPLAIGMRQLLSVPESDGKRSVTREYQVARCDLRTDGRYAIELATHVHVPSAKDRVVMPPKRSHLKLIILAAACMGLIAVMFAPL
jgi:hypothetical protein